MKFTRDYAYNNCIQKVQINFGELLDLDKDEDAYVILKELPTLETMQLNDAHEKGNVALIEFFIRILPSIIVEHNFYEEGDKLMKNIDVVSFIFSKLELSSKLMDEYTKAVFRSRESQTAEK